MKLSYILNTTPREWWADMIWPAQKYLKSVSWDNRLLGTAAALICGAFAWLWRNAQGGNIAHAQTVTAPHKPAPQARRTPHMRRVRLIGKGTMVLDMAKYKNGVGPRD